MSLCVWCLRHTTNRTTTLEDIKKHVSSPPLTNTSNHSCQTRFSFIGIHRMRDWRANYTGIISLHPAEGTPWNKGKYLSWIKPWAQRCVGDGRDSRRRLETLFILSSTRRLFNPRPVYAILRSGAGRGLSLNTSVLPCQYHSTDAACLFTYRRRYITPEVHSVIK
jgi:hypothetical protein